MQKIPQPVVGEPRFAGLTKTFASYSKSSVLGVLRDGIRTGTLFIVDSEGSHTFGELVDGGRTATIRVLSENFWLRVTFSHDLGFSESYLLGEFETDSLKDVLNLWLDNRDTLAGLDTLYNRISTSISSFAMRLFGQTLENARLNASTGYDCSNTLFSAFLSKEMMYSCALWDESDGGLRGDLVHGPIEGDLERAQARKLQHILNLARVKPGHRLLEFGSGWGGMAIAAAKRGASVDTLTLSIEQKKWADERIKEEGLQDMITVHLMDYRMMPESWAGKFDAFVSCEMFEAVGEKNHNQFFKILDWALKPKNSAAVVTATAQPEFRYSLYQPSDYAREYQWPNSFLPSATSFCVAVQNSVPGKFVLVGVEDHAPHYCRTLREWDRRLEKAWTPEFKAKLVAEQPELGKGINLDIVKRKWEYMYVYAEVGYARAYSAMNCWTIARPEYPVERCD